MPRRRAPDPWSRIIAFLAEAAPDMPAFPGPMLAEEVVLSEIFAFGRLPAAWRRWLVERCGGGPMLGTWQLHTLEDARQSRQIMLDLRQKGWAGHWNPKWIPFAGDGAGGELVLGSRGRVIHVPRAPEDWEIEEIAPSFTAWLESIADALASGELVVCEDADGRFTGVRRADTVEALKLRVRGEPATGSPR